MAVTVRPARPGDPAAELLQESARSYYAAFAGSDARARALLRSVYPHGGHSASFQVCVVAEDAGRVVGALSGFGAEDAQRYARRFVALSLARLPPGAWPGMTRHLRAAARVSPPPPPRAWYVDGLAVAPASRRRGVAAALLDAAERAAVAAGRTTLALDTGLENDAAQALYQGRGFRWRGESRAPDAATARALGGTGFVSYAKTVAAGRGG
jgi:ribosomal protein S18 acetylase RimI-like enzyme